MAQEITGEQVWDKDGQLLWCVTRWIPTGSFSVCWVFSGFVFLKKGVLLFFSMLALNIRKTGFLMLFFFFKLASSSKAFLGFSSLSLR